jgi:hypothetical protein
MVLLFFRCIFFANSTLVEVLYISLLTGLETISFIEVNVVSLASLGVTHLHPWVCLLYFRCLNKHHVFN